MPAQNFSEALLRNQQNMKDTKPKQQIKDTSEWQGCPSLSFLHLICKHRNELKLETYQERIEENYGVL